MLAAAALLALSGALALPAAAQAQEISLVSNIGQGHNTNLNINPPDFEQFGVEIGENRGAQRFTTGPNEAGYTLQSVVLNLHTNRGTGSVVQVAIHDNASSGNPGTLLVVLDNPADPIGNNTGTAGNRTFSAPNPLSLDADTHYWVMVSNTTTNNETNFDVSLTTSNNETTGHGFSIRNTRHQGTPGSWLEQSASKLRMEVRGTVVIPPGLEVTLHLSDDEPLEDLLAVTVTATASPASPVAFTVEISGSPVAPATDDDFTLSTNRTLSFAANATESTGTVTIDPVADDEPEPNDVVTVSGVVSNPAIPNPDDVRLTILNDDADLPQDIAIDAPAAVDEGAGTANVTVTLTTLQNTAPVIDAQLFYRQHPGTATRGDDYTRPQGLGNRIAIVPVSEFSANADGTAWVARHSFEIGIVDDGEAEADETIVFQIYNISDNRGIEQTIVIRDDDRPSAVSIAAANAKVLEEQPAVFTLSRTGATGSALTVTVALTEQADRDLLPDGAATERTVTFARGSSTAALTVELENDRLAEPDGDLIAAVRAGAGYTVGDPSSATVTVDDVDGVPVIERIGVVSTPRLRWRNSREEDTYGEGENIRIGVRFDLPVHVEGEPTMALEVGDPCGSVCEARYESGSGTDTLVFAYLVLEVDFDRNGIAIPANPVEVVYGDSIRSGTDHEANLSYRREGTQSGHKVDGSRAAGPYLSVEDAEAHEADRKMDFTVRLEPHGLGIVTVDYATRDGSARAGSDYTETSGTLRFNSLEMERTVTVPIIDDAEEDDGETFTLRLSNPEGAALRDGDRAARGTIRNSDPEATPLTASFEDVPAEHDGESAFTLRMAFSESLSMMNGRRLREDVVAVSGGRATSAGRVDRRRDLWELTVEPDSRADVTVTLAAGAACGTPAAICTSDGRSLSEGISTTVAGPADEGPQPNTPATGAPTIGGTPRVGDELIVSTSDISDADGLDDARFAYQWIRAASDISGATSPDYTVVEADEGERLKVRVSFTDDAGNSESLTSAATDAVAARPEPLTASFENMPSEHDGESAFTFRIASSDRLSMMNGRRLREDVVEVSGGRATSAGRVNRRRDLWELTVEPHSSADVTVTVAAGAACGTPAAVCTSDGRALSNSISATVRGPVGISVADAHVEEDDGAVLAFAVTLTRAASRALTVDYATSDGSAQAGVDYTAASGTLTFQAGESSRTIEVAVLDDAHDEGEETLTLRLSNASSGARVTDAEATGTIKNTDLMPAALLARFGRAAAEQVVEHIEERMAAPRQRGFRARLAGRELRPGSERDFALGFLSQFAQPMGAAGAVGAVPMGGAAMGGAGSMTMGSHTGGAGAFGAGPAGLSGGALGATGTIAPGGGAPGMTGMGGVSGMTGAIGMTGQQAGYGPMGSADGGGLFGSMAPGGGLFSSSEFELNRESRGGILSVWSRSSRSHFSGMEDALSLDGDVRTTMIGADYVRGPLTVGLSVGRTLGLGGYRGPSGGQMTTSMTGFYPWVGYQVNDRVSVWGVTGYGTGALSLTPDGASALETGVSMAMTAVGTRGELIGSRATGGFALAFKADALLVNAASDLLDDPTGRLNASAAGVTRVRTALEGSRGFRLGGGRLSLTPSVEVGLRRDGGDAETGAGMDMGGGLAFSDTVTGLSLDVRVRTLVVHQAEGFAERGMSLSFGWNPTPSSPLGLTARVAPSWGGSAQGGAEALWGNQMAYGMGSHRLHGSGGQVNAEVGYGLPVGARFVGTPRVGLATSQYGRDYRFGYGLGVLEQESLSFELGVDAQRRESPMQGGASNGVLGRATLAW